MDSYRKSKTNEIVDIKQKYTQICLATETIYIWLTDLVSVTKENTEFIRSKINNKQKLLHISFFFINTITV